MNWVGYELQRLLIPEFLENLAQDQKSRVSRSTEYLVSGITNNLVLIRELKELYSDLGLSSTYGRVASMYHDMAEYRRQNRLLDTLQRYIAVSVPEGASFQSALCSYREAYKRQNKLDVFFDIQKKYLESAR